MYIHVITIIIAINIVVIIIIIISQVQFIHKPTKKETKN